MVYMPSHSPSLRETKTGTEAETLEEYCLKACCPWPAQPYAARTACPGMALPSRESARNVIEMVLSIEVLSSQTTLTCVKLTKTNKKLTRTLTVFRSHLSLTFILFESLTLTCVFISWENIRFFSLS